MNSSNLVRAKQVGFLFLLGMLYFCPPAHALSAPHHLYKASRRLVEAVGGPLYGIFYDGPKRMKKAYQEEVWGAEKPEKRGKPIRVLKAVPRALGEEAKATVDGVTQSVVSAGQAAKELISVFLGD